MIYFTVHIVAHCVGDLRLAQLPVAEQASRAGRGGVGVASQGVRVIPGEPRHWPPLTGGGRR